MNNVPSIKSSKTESPKTPGGISKSLLTPCRRVGLSRNWKRSGSSPFISPLSNGDTSQDKTEVRKRKEHNEEKGKEICGDLADNSQSGCNINVDKTPSRSTGIPRRKKSKTLLSAIKAEEETGTIVSSSVPEIFNKEGIRVCSDIGNNIQVSDPISAPVCLKSKSKSKKSLSSVVTGEHEIHSQSGEHEIHSQECSNINVGENDSTVVTNKEHSPRDLVKECIVVIRKKILKQESNDIINATIDNKPKEDIQKVEKSSQGLFDSDSDDVPLCKINNREVKMYSPLDNDEDDDFIENKKDTKKAVKERTLVKKTKDSKIKMKNSLKTTDIDIQPTKIDPSEDDDFEFDNKRTILIRKSYEKVSKPLKAKSTGSITQRDIDDIRARIESKKKVLLAKAMTEDTQELRDLIKKWRIGCQNALTELMELMKHKFPDKQNMDYSEILKSLNIPSSLVGYDSDNECFNTPDDATIILSGLNL